VKDRKSPWRPLSFEGLNTYSLKDRPSKVQVEDFARPWAPGGSLEGFLQSLPSILAADQFREAADALAKAVQGGRTVILGMGAHPIKVGLNPVIADLMRRGVLSALALNGAGIIHDVELALAGKTSEDVGAHLCKGQFGAARETSQFIHGAVAAAHAHGGVGLGEAVGRALVEGEAPFAHMSLLATAWAEEVPVSVHVAFGTDIIHMSPAMDGAAMGALTHHDFRLFCRMVSLLNEGVYMNLGSAVVLPEVFLKAVSVVHNLGHSLESITTLNMDFQRHYRPQVNVIQRPTGASGRGITLIGHHEIMFPLLAAAVLEKLEKMGISQRLNKRLNRGSHKGRN